MVAWWNDLSFLQQVFGIVAIPSTLILIIQVILFIVGFADHDGNVDVAHHDFQVHDLHPSDPHDLDQTLNHGETEAIKLFTLRSVIAFFSVGGWTGLVLGGMKMPVPAIIILALLAGFGALYFVAWSVKMAFRMQASGNIQLENAVGTVGDVYLTIPASGKGQGKVNVIVQERLCELEATTPVSRDIKTGESIVIIGVSHDGVVVMPHEEEIKEEM